MLQTFLHYGIHFLVPLIVALVFFKSLWVKAFLIMMACFIIDLDHLLANPIFAPNRCGINFHPLHSYYAIIIYALMLIPKNTRLVGLGLCIHILADSVDCLLM
jgi:hypothetical protein